MKKWIAVPNEKIGNIVFGMNREEVRALFDNKYTEFKKTPFSENSTDDFGNFHVYYDKNEKCEAVEVFGDIEIEMHGKKIFPETVLTLKELIDDLEDDGYGYTSVSCSIGVTLDDDSDTISGILFGTKDYYL